MPSITDFIKPKSPTLGPTQDFSRVIYADPPSHDFCEWLIGAEAVRRAKGIIDPLRVTLALFDGMLGRFEYGWTHSLSTGPNCALDIPRSYSAQMIPNIIQPAIEMLGAVREPDMHLPIIGPLPETEYDYHLRNLVDASRAGFALPEWTPPQWAQDEAAEFLREKFGSTKPIIITLRETGVQYERNSQSHEWMKFCTWAEQAGHKVLIIRDTAFANQSWSRQSYPRASTNAYVRVAVYQQALVNMLVCNGPCVWLFHSQAPWLLFKQLIPALPQWDHGNARGWREQDHLEIGDQLPWAIPGRQHMTWKDDTYQNIKAEFSAFLKRL